MSFAQRRHPYLLLFLIFVGIGVVLLPVRFLSGGKSAMTVICVITAIMFWVLVAVIFMARHRPAGHRSYH